MDARTNELISAPPLPLLVRMATPNSIAFFIQAGVSLAEVWFISQLGTLSLAAIALVFPLLMLTQTMSGGAMGGAVASAIARALGGGDKDRAESLIWHALILAAIGAVTFLILFLLAGESFLMFLGGSGDILNQAMAYMIILFSGGLFIWLLMVVSAIFRGMGNMKLPALMMVVNACVQVPLSGVLVLGVFGFPQLGVAGAAVSAIVSGLLVSGAMLMLLVFGDHPIKLALRSFSLKKDLFQDLLQVFLPASLSPLLSVGTIVGLTAIVGRFGEAALAGYGIGSRIEFLIIPLVFGLGASMTSLVGLSVGANNIQRAEQVGWTGGFSAFAVAGIVGLMLAIYPEVWIPQFTDNAEVLDAATRYIQIVGPAYAFFGIGLALYFASQGARAMFWPVAATVVRVVLAVGGALLLAFVFELGLDGVYYAAALGMTAYGLMIGVSLKLGAWRRQT